MSVIANERPRSDSPDLRSLVLQLKHRASAIWNCRLADYEVDRAVHPVRWLRHDTSTVMDLA